jgi:hypothetical protein
MSDRALQILNCLLEQPVITVEPGFPLTLRTAYGVHGDKNDLALSVEWHDADGCLWAADFSEDALALAKLRQGTISMHDVGGTEVVFRLYKPADQVDLSLNWSQ